MNINVEGVVRFLRKSKNGMKGLILFSVLNVEKEILKNSFLASPLLRGLHPLLLVTHLDLTDFLESNGARWFTGTQRPISPSPLPSS